MMVNRHQCVVILYLALRPALERAGLLPKGEKH